MATTSRQITLPFTASEEQPYLFASYGHNDKDKVFPLLKALYEEGYNVWYDQGITIGADYDRTIKTHIAQSEVFLFFASDLSVTRAYILDDELPYASESHSGGRILTWLLGEDVTIPERAAVHLSSKCFTSLEQVLEALRALDMPCFGRRTAVPVERDVPPYWHDDYSLDATGGSGNIVSTEETPYVCLAFHPGDLTTCNPYAKELLYAGYNVRSCENEDAVGRASMISDRDCAAYIPFLTKKYVESGQLERDYAASKEAGKPFIALYMKTYDENGREEHYEIPKSISAEFRAIQGLNIGERTVNDFLSELEVDLEKRGCYASMKDGRVERRSFEIPDFLYEFSGEEENRRKGIVLTKYAGNAEKLEFRRSYGGYPVREIGGEAFRNNESIRTAVIPDGVERIGKMAFASCNRLRELTVPPSIIQIDDSAFAWSWELKTVRISDLAHWCSVIFDGGHYTNPLYGADKLYVNGELIRDLVVPEGVTVIGDNAFTGYDGLHSLTIPAGVENIGNSAFSNSNGLNSVAIAEGVRSIGDHAFAWCRHLPSVTIPGSVASIGDSAFHQCEELVSLTLGDGVKKIGKEAFRECEKLCSVEIPGSVEEVGKGAFTYCRALASVKIGDGVRSIGDEAFEYCDSLSQVSIPDSVGSLGDSVFFVCEGLKHVRMPAGITAVSENMFRDCEKLRSVILPAGVTEISDYAFYGCSGFTVYCPKDSETWKTCEREDIPHKPLSGSHPARLILLLLLLTAIIVAGIQISGLFDLLEWLTDFMR